MVAVRCVALDDLHDFVQIFRHHVDVFVAWRDEMFAVEHVLSHKAIPCIPELFIKQDNGRAVNFTRLC